MRFRPKDPEELQHVGRFMLRRLAQDVLSFDERHDAVKSEYYSKNNYEQAVMLFDWWKEKFPGKPLEVVMAEDAIPIPEGYELQKMADDDCAFLVKKAKKG